MALGINEGVGVDQHGRELKQHGTALFPAAFYYGNISEMLVPWHWHEELEVIFVVSGTAHVAVNGTDHLVKQGEGFFVNTGALHGVWPEGEEVCREYDIVFHPRLVGGSVDSIIWQKYLEPLLSDARRCWVHFPNSQEWEKTASSLIQEAWQAGVSEAEGFELTVRELLSRLVFLLAKHSHSTEKMPSEKALRDGERIKVMLQYIQTHYDEELSLAKIAGSAAVSANECLRCFRAMIGSTPIQYIKQLRIQKAAELLLTTDLKVSDIGARCGFQEMSYFAKTFRELKGCTPSEFRSGARDER